MRQYSGDEIAAWEEEKERQRRDLENRRNNGCFPAGTLINTPAGKKDIVALRVGQEIQSYDSHSGNLRNQRILKILRHGKNQLWQLQLNDGSMVKTTAVHSFRVGGRWKQASKIKIDDKLLLVGADGQKRVRVVASKPLAEVCEVYNLIIDGDFTFVADGAVAHSFSHCRFIRMCLWKVRALVAHHWPERSKVPSNAITEKGKVLA